MTFLIAVWIHSEHSVPNIFWMIFLPIKNLFDLKRFVQDKKHYQKIIHSEYFDQFLWQIFSEVWPPVKYVFSNKSFWDYLMILCLNQNCKKVCLMWPLSLLFIWCKCVNNVIVPLVLHNFMLNLLDMKLRNAIGKHFWFDILKFFK